MPGVGKIADYRESSDAGFAVVILLQAVACPGCLFCGWTVWADQRRSTPVRAGPRRISHAGGGVIDQRRRSATAAVWSPVQCPSTGDLLIEPELPPSMHDDGDILDTRSRLKQIALSGCFAGAAVEEDVALPK